MADTLAVGSRAPDFTLPDHTGAPVTLSALLERGPVVLYFYPKDETLGCTMQACEFRDKHQRFTTAVATVVGVSDDSVESHRSFAEHHGLPFVLLSDGNGQVRSLYGVKKVLGLLPGRVTFVIDEKGTVRHVYTSAIHARRHVEEALRVVESLRAQSAAAAR